MSDYNKQHRGHKESPLRRLIWRLLDTPVSDLARGRITPRGDFKDVLAASSLTNELQAAITQVVERAYWQRGERVRLTQSLVEICKRRLDEGSDTSALIDTLQSATEKPRYVEWSVYLQRLLAGDLPEDILALLIQVTNPIQSRKLHAATQSSLAARWATSLREGTTPEQLQKDYANTDSIGRLVNQLGDPKIITTIELPATLRQIVLDVITKTRLWPVEKRDVAAELSEHFFSGLESRQTPEQLSETFGDPSVAARLIRRAKLRCRPLYWQAARRVVQSTLVLLFGISILWLVLMGRLMATPTVQIDFVKQFDERSRAVPNNERAWPKYRDGLLLHSLWQGDSESKLEFSNGDDWPQAEQFLDANRESLARFVEASQLRHLGFRYNDPGNTAWLQKEGGVDWQLYDPTKSVMSVLLPHAQHFRQTIAGLIHWALIEAERQGDADRVAELLNAMVRVSTHAAETSDFEVSKNIGRVVLKESGDELLRLLKEDAIHISEDDLRELAAEIERAFEASKSVIDNDVRVFAADILQNVYTDDGKGNGRVTHVGMRLMCEIDGEYPIWMPHLRATHPLQYLTYSAASASNSIDRVRFSILSTAASPMIASRQEAQSVVDDLVGKIRNDLSTPYWQQTESQFKVTYDHLASTSKNRTKYAPVLIPTANTAAIFDGHRFGNVVETIRKDAWLVAIALELYHRRHDNWPDSLQKLVDEDLMKAIPIDQFDGKPLRYQLDEVGKPLLYSVGPDRFEDGTEMLLSALEMSLETPYAHVHNSQLYDDVMKLKGDWRLLP